MGWTSYQAKNRINGKVDRVAEVNDILTWEGDNGKCEPVKTAAVGSTVYSAVKRTDKDGKSIVFGVVFLTHTNSKDYYDFSYKDIEESCGPCQRDCPVGILDCLSPVDDVYEHEESRKRAAEWRQACRDNAKAKLDKKHDPDALGNLPLGTTIRWTYFDGQKDDSMVLVKEIHAGKRGAIWMTTRNTYVPQTRIKRFEILSRPYGDEESKARFDEAQKRLWYLHDQYKLHTNVLSDFTKGKLNICDPMGLLYWENASYSKALHDALEEFKPEYGTPYLILESMLDDMRLFAVLYVSKHHKEWDMDNDDLKIGQPLAYVFNETYPQLSEFGYIGFKPQFGGLVREH